MLHYFGKPRREAILATVVLEFEDGLKITLRVDRLSKGKPRYRVRMIDSTKGIKPVYDESGHWSDHNEYINTVLDAYTKKHGTAIKQTHSYERG